MVRKTFDTHYLRDVGILVVGNALAQVITLACAPVLTRLYEPDAFGTLGLFVAMVAALAPGVCGRYEIAAIVASDRQEQVALYWLAMWFAFAFCSLAFVVIAIGLQIDVNNRFFLTLGSWVWVLPLALFLTGVIANLRAWANAERHYAQLSRSMLVQAVVSSITAMALGLCGLTGAGLLIATNISLLATAAALFIRYKDLKDNHLWELDPKKWSVAMIHKEYPLLNAPTSILNGLMTSIPFFYIARYFPAEVVGYYALLIRVGATPLSFLSDAISRVNLKEVSVIINENRSPIGYFMRVTGVLIIMAAVPTFTVVSAAPEAFAVAFGARWREAGVLLAILMPALAVQFIVSTLSLSLVAAGRLRLLALWQVLSVAVTLVVFESFPATGSARDFFNIFMLKDVILYAVYFAMLIYALRHPTSVKPIMP
jgi:lipopolysaccharide exporter